MLHHHRLLREALAGAVRWQLITRNPCDSVAPPRPQRTEMRVLDEKGAKRLLDAAAAEPLYPFFHVAIMTGARLGELLALRWQNIDFDTEMMFITQTVRRYSDKGWVFSTPKTHRSRRPIALDGQTRVVLQEHRRHQLERRLLVGPAYEEYDLVFATPTGLPLGDSTVRTAFARILSAAGLARMRIHDLRHTTATLLLRAGVNPKVVSERLGHTTVSVTLDTYSHVLPDTQRDAAEALAAVVRRAVVGSRE